MNKLFFCDFMINYSNYCYCFNIMAVPNNITKYNSIFESNNVKYGLDPILLKVQIAAESRFINVTTANEAGAVEIAQFTQIAAEKSR